MSLFYTKRFLTSTARNLSKVKVDSDGLPLAPTWSVRSLLNIKDSSTTAATTTISDEQLDHLVRLAQLQPPKNTQDRAQLTKDLDDLTTFIQSIQQKDFGDTTPMTHVWQDSTGMALRNDDIDDTQPSQAKGTSLLNNAKQVFPPFFAVKGQHHDE